MSADLWADFVASVDQNPVEKPPTRNNNFDDLSQHDLGGPDDGDFDDFGDFQDAGLTQRTAARVVPGNVVTTSKQGQSDPLRPGDVLFDADDPEEVPENGADSARRGLGSEQPRHKVQDIPEPAVVDLIDFDDHPVKRETGHKNLVISRPTSAHIAAPTTPVCSSEQVEEDEWDDFETTASSNNAAETQITLPTHITTMMTTKLPPSSSLQPPTGIPPPSILLALFPPLISDLSRNFLQPANALPQSEKPSFLSRPDVHSLLKAYSALAHVLAHLLAGRKHRWKRDKHLAQSMSIGPSISGRSGGMKLTGLDRSEAAREDVAAAEAVSVWKANAGRLRSLSSAVQQLVGAGQSVPAVLEIAGSMPVRIEKVAQGAVVGLHACGLCGLKREERVGRVDDAVEDMFDEWWLENPRMHVSCWRFWDAQRDLLRSR